jgi:hypothetical protein
LTGNPTLSELLHMQDPRIYTSRVLLAILRRDSEDFFEFFIATVRLVSGDAG